MYVYIYIYISLFSRWVTCWLYKLPQWITKIINAGKQLKVGRQAGLSDVEESGLKY